MVCKTWGVILSNTNINSKYISNLLDTQLKIINLVMMVGHLHTL